MIVEPTPTNIQRNRCIGFVKLADEHYIKLCQHEPCCLKILDLDAEGINTAAAADLRMSEASLRAAYEPLPQAAAYTKYE